MRLVGVEQKPSPTQPGHVRLSGRIELAKDDLRTVWYEVSERFADGFSETANPWLVVMLPYALERGGEIHVDLPADPLLVENLRGVVATWCAWNPSYLKPVEIVAKPAPMTFVPTRSASFFSGGIDSWFTALRYSDKVEVPVGHVDDLITVWGFGIELSAPAEFQAHVDSLRSAATALHKTLVPVTTNLKPFSDSPWRHHWGSLTHGAGLASVALALERRWSAAILGSTYSFDVVHPWGSHPMIDVLFSTTRTRLVHDGAAFTRLEKTELIASFELALNNLQVCSASGSSRNCCNCEKCYRTMVTLDLIGALDRCSRFPGQYTVNLLAKTYIDNVSKYFWPEIAALAIKRSRTDVAAAIQASFRRSLWINFGLGLTKRMMRIPAIWRLGPVVRSALHSLGPS